VAAAKQFPVDDTLTHRTPRGGCHLIFELPAPPWPIIGCPQRINGRPALAYGVEVKGEGGSLIWAGSPGYVVTCDVAPARLPRWVLRLLTEEPKAGVGPAVNRWAWPFEAQLRGIVDCVEHSKEGERNRVCFWGACRAGVLVRAGRLSEVDPVEIVAGAAVRAGLPRLEALATARSGVRTGSREE
jgi:hypothetical protein